MSVFPCSCHGLRRPGKLATAYWAWFNTDGARVAYHVRYCLDGAHEHLQILLAATSPAEGSSNVFACIVCGADSSEDSDPIYCTLYLPKKDPMEYALQLDSACAEKLRHPVRTIGKLLPDRGGLVRGPSPSTTAWDALGLGPSES